MIDQQINEQLGLLQEELSRLKNITDYIDTAKENSVSIVAELEKIQQNYATQLNKLSELHRQSVVDLQKSAEMQIGEGALNFGKTGNIIENANRENLAETRRLLDHYKNIVEATGALIKQISDVDFPARLSVIENEAKSLSELGKKTAKHLEDQDKEIRSLKVILIAACGLTSVVVVGIIFIIIKQNLI